MLSKILTGKIDHMNLLNLLVFSIPLNVSTTLNIIKMVLYVKKIRENNFIYRAQIKVLCSYHWIYFQVIISYQYYRTKLKKQVHHLEYAAMLD